MSRKRDLIKLIAANVLAFSSAFMIGTGLRDANIGSSSKNSTPQIHVATRAYTRARLTPVGVQTHDHYMLNNKPDENKTLRFTVRVFDDNLERLVISDSRTDIPILDFLLKENILDKDFDEFFGTIRADIRYDEEHSDKHLFNITAVDKSGNKTHYRVQTLHNTIVKKETNYKDTEAPYIIFLDKAKDWFERYTGEGYTALIMYSDKSISQIGDEYRIPFDEELAFSARTFDHDMLSYKLYINDLLVDEEDYSKEREFEGMKALSPANNHSLFYHPTIPRHFPGEKYEIHLEVKDRIGHTSTRTVTVVDGRPTITEFIPRETELLLLLTRMDNC